MQGGGRAAGVILKSEREVVFSTTAAPRQGGVSCGAPGAAHLRLRPQGTQVALQVPVGHQLHHNQRGLALGYHPQETDLESKDVAWVGVLDEGRWEDLNSPRSPCLITHGTLLLGQMPGPGRGRVRRENPGLTVWWVGAGLCVNPTLKHSKANPGLSLDVSEHTSPPSGLHSRCSLGLTLFPHKSTRMSLHPVSLCSNLFLYS